jgi:hypothetical protein
MKITRSALKNLIKEEMRRINEDPLKSTGTPTTEVGDAMVELSAHSDGDKIDEMIHGFVAAGQVEGLEALRDVGVVRLEGEVPTRAYNYALKLWWPGRRTATSSYSRERGKPYGKTDVFHLEVRKDWGMVRLPGPAGRDEERPGYDQWLQAKEDIEKAIATFNAQNNHKGARIIINGQEVARSAGKQYPGANDMDSATPSEEIMGREIDLPITKA